MNVSSIVTGAVLGMAGSKVIAKATELKPATTPIYKLTPNFSNGPILLSSASLPLQMRDGYKTLFVAIATGTELPHADALATEGEQTLFGVKVTHSNTGSAATLLSVTGVYDTDAFNIGASQGFFKDGVFVNSVDGVADGTILSFTLPYSFGYAEFFGQVAADLVSPTEYAWVSRAALVEGQFRSEDFAKIQARVVALWASADAYSLADVPAA